MDKELERDCIPYEKIIKVDQIAEAYVPYQNLCSIYRAEESLRRGTIFPELDKPYMKNKPEPCKKCKSVLIF